MQTAATAEERKRVLEFWLQYIRPGKYPDLCVDGDLGHKNGVKIASYIQDAYNNNWSSDNLTAAVSAIKNELWGLGIATPEQAKSREQKANEAAVKQRAEQIDAHNQATIVKWLRDECPLGLIVSGDLYGTTQDKVIAFIKRTLSGKELILTPQLLSDAVATLGPALDWFSRASEGVVLRNQPAPPTRQEILSNRLSEKAKREGGLLPPKSDRATHSDSDGKFRDPIKEIKDVVKTALQRQGVKDPWQERLENLVVQGRGGKIDAVKSTDLRSVRVIVNGEVDWRASFQKADKLADLYEAQKNRRVAG
jgi:hypothetical protein